MPGESPDALQQSGRPGGQMKDLGRVGGKKAFMSGTMILKK